MDIRKIKKLIELVEESGISELEISDNEESIRISGLPTMLPAQSAPVVQNYAPQPSAPPPVASQTHTDSSAENEVVKEDNSANAFCSPMVGTYYEASSPDKPVFVKTGSVVKAGDVLCIIEAMKIMNQVVSDRAGTVEKILVNDGEPIEFNQPLFIIK